MKNFKDIFKQYNQILKESFIHNINPETDIKNRSEETIQDNPEVQKNLLTQIKNCVIEYGKEPRKTDYMKKYISFRTFLKPEFYDLDLKMFDKHKYGIQTFMDEMEFYRKNLVNEKLPDSFFDNVKGQLKKIYIDEYNNLCADILIWNKKPYGTIIFFIPDDINFNDFGVNYVELLSSLIFQTKNLIKIFNKTKKRLKLK